MHTPTPWNTTEPQPGVKIAIMAQDGQHVADVIDQGLGVDTANMKANADFIVRAVNSHEDLLAACKQAMGAFVNHLDYDCNESSVERESYRALRAAIAKAER